MYTRKKGQVVDAIIPSYLFKKDDPVLYDRFVKFMNKPNTKTFKELEHIYNVDELKILVANQVLLSVANGRLKPLASLLYTGIRETDPILVNNLLDVKLKDPESTAKIVNLVTDILATYTYEPYMNSAKYKIENIDNYRILILNNRTYINLIRNSFLKLDPEEDSKLRALVNVIIDDLCYTIYNKDPKDIDDLIPSDFHTLVISSLMNLENA